MEQTYADCAFLYDATLDEEIYMEQPKSLVEYAPDGRPLVCRLFTAVYGLKQTPHNWHHVLQDLMITMKQTATNTSRGLRLPQQRLDNPGNHRHQR